MSAVDSLTPVTTLMKDSNPTVIDAPVSEKDDLESAAQSKEPSIIDEHIIPDGGLRAWCSVAGSFLFLFSTFGYVNAFGVYQTYYVEILLPSYSPSAISWIGSLQLCLLFGMGSVTGILFDAQRVHVALIGGSILYVGCIFALSAVPQDAYYAVFLSQGVGQGLAQGLLYLPAMAINAHHFQKRRALAMGVTICGSSIGGIVFPILLNNVFQTSGFGGAVRASGYLIMACLVLANLLIATHYNPNHKAMPKPSVFKFLRNDLAYDVTLIGAFFVVWAIFMIFFFMPLYAVTHGISENLSFYTITIINAASFFGRTVPNVIADFTGPFILVTPMMTACTALIFALFGVQSVGSVVIYCLLYGFFSGGIFSLSAPIMALLSDDMSEYGTRLGFAFLVMGLASLTGVPVSGALVGWEAPYTWWKAIVFGGTTMAVGTAFLVWAWALQSKKKGTIWV